MDVEIMEVVFYSVGSFRLYQSHHMALNLEIQACFYPHIRDPQHICFPCKQQNQIQ